MPPLLLPLDDEDDEDDDDDDDDDEDDDIGDDDGSIVVVDVVDLYLSLYYFLPSSTPPGLSDISVWQRCDACCCVLCACDVRGRC